MAFTDELGRQSAVGDQFRSGIYGMPTQTTDNDALSLVNQIKDREMRDFKDKNNFMADLSIRQEQRMREMDTIAQAQNKQANQNTVMGGTQPSAFPIDDPGAGMSGPQKAEFNLKKQELEQKSKFGQEALDIKDKQEQLNQQKSDQIHDQKIAELAQKTDAAQQHMAFLQEQLKDRTKTARDILELHKQMAAAADAWHKAQMAQKDAEFAKTNEYHNNIIANQERKLKDQENVSTTTKVNPEGTEKTVSTKRGAETTAPTKNSDGTYSVVAPDGTKGTIPANKLQDWLQNHQPGGGQDQNQPPAFENQLPDMSRFSQPGQNQPPVSQPITTTGGVFRNPYQYQPGGNQDQEEDQ